MLKKRDMESLKYESPRVSLMAQIETALSYDDVLLLPAESAVLPAEVELSTRLTTGIALNAPISLNTKLALNPQIALNTKLALIQA